MSIQRAEQLKREWTDQCVIVRDGIPELRRFERLLGRVRTVNMNCRLLVEFDTPADISWYDIDPSFVTLVDPAEVSSASESTIDDSVKSSRPATGSPTAAQPTQSSSAAGGSPLDRIRQQAAGKVSSPPSAVGESSGKGSKPPQTSSAAGGSPLDRIRQQAASSASIAAQAPTVRPSAAPEPAAEMSSVGGESGTQAGRQDTAASKPDDVGTVPAPEQPEAAPAAVKTTRPVLASEQTATPSAFDQVAAQADESKGESSEQKVQASLFDQIQQQATADGHDEVASASSMPQGLLSSNAGDVASETVSATDSEEKASASDDVTEQAAAADSDVAGDEDPVKTTFRGKTLPKKNDLRVIEGIGPKISQLFHDAGIMTWDEMADADTERLNQILEDAGPRFRMHVPDTWPAQAKLAAAGQWQELEELQDRLDGGREPEES